MKTSEIKQILQRYFEGTSTLPEERCLEAYFRSGSVAPELEEYRAFFSGLAEIPSQEENTVFQDAIMNHILENESKAKSHYHSMWKTVTGIAASIIIVLGGLLFYQQKEALYADTFDNPEDAYAYAMHTMQYVSAKYNKGVAELDQFEKFAQAQKTLQKGVTPVNKVLEQITPSDTERTDDKK